jgi:hypothetical protein
MIIVGDKLISEDIIDRHFICDLKACKGACCVDGDSGAPLLESETRILESELPVLKEWITEEGRRAVEEQGAFMKDSDGDWVTPLIEGRQCAYTVFESDGTASCGIEKAWKAGATPFQKPISCHLYPIRVSPLAEYEALNYHRWNICSPACALGREHKVPVYRFLKEALVRAFGEAWYTELEVTAQAWEEGRRDP